MHHIKNSLENIANDLVKDESEESLAEEIRKYENTYNRLTKLVKLPFLARLTRTVDPERQKEHKKIHMKLYAKKAAYARKTGNEQAYNQFLKEANNYNNA